MREFLRWSRASGWSLNPAKCVFVPLWVFCDGEVRDKLRAECPSLELCLGDSRALLGGGDRARRVDAPVDCGWSEGPPPRG